MKRIGLIGHGPNAHSMRDRITEDDHSLVYWYNDELPESSNIWTKHGCHLDPNEQHLTLKDLELCEKIYILTNCNWEQVIDKVPREKIEYV